MRRYYYDFHIHTALSPCGDDDMTPENIAEMTKLIGLDVIAVTDHNSCGNALSVSLASKKIGGALVIPGLELETSEAIHVLMLFPDISAANKCEQIISSDMPKIKNKVEIFGRQLYMDSEDNILGEKEDLLIISTNIDLEGARILAENLGGIAIPAHIDKSSNSIISILGSLSPDMGFKTVEVSALMPRDEVKNLQRQGYMVIHDSDAHYLENMNDKNENFLELDELTAVSVIDALKNIRQEK